MMKDLNNRFDVFYLNSFLYEEHPALKSTENKSSLYYFLKFFPRILYVFFIKSFRRGFFRNFLRKEKFSKRYKDQIFLVSLTQNNHNAVKKLLSEFEKRGENYIEIRDVLSYDVAPVLRLFWIALISFPKTLVRFIQQSPEQHFITGAYLIDFFMTPAYVWFVKEILLKETPKVVVLSNDHVNINRAIEYTCQERCIKSLYIQHASVGDNYPKPCFTSCIFDGLDSLIKYDTSETIPLILGAMRYDDLKSNRIKKSKQINKQIGLAVNIIDTEEIVRNLCIKIHDYLPDYKIVIRAHPNMLRHPYNIDFPYVKYTNARDESILSFFSNIDVLISNDSCIHLDAIELGVKSYMMTLSTEGFTDQYCYTKKGLVELIVSDEDLKDHLLALSNVELTDASIVRFYDESYMKSYETFLPTLVSDFICSGLDVDYMRDTHQLVKGNYMGSEYYYIEK